jgi:hypothetical protein
MVVLKQAVFFVDDVRCCGWSCQEGQPAEHLRCLGNNVDRLCCAVVCAGTGLTDWDNCSMYGKLVLFVFAAWAGTAVSSPDARGGLNIMLGG